MKALTRMLAPQEHWLERVSPLESELFSLREKNQQLTTYVYVMGGILLLIFLVARR